MNAPITWPAGDFSRVPYPVFYDAQVFADEQERLYRGAVWNYLALEAELPRPGDFKTSYVGNTPVIVARDKDGALHAFVNRCAHRGAIVQREERGNDNKFRCIYHQWCYDLKGDLIGVPFRRGVNGAGGYPEDFDMKAHGLQKLRVGSYRGIIFGSFSDAVPPLEDYLGDNLRGFLDTRFAKPVKVLGYMRQLIPSNWKLYFENVKDPYHAGLLHLFHATFGIYRSTQRGACLLSPDKHSSVLYNIGGDYDKDKARDEYKGQTKFEENYNLADPRLMYVHDDHGDGVANMIMSIFPSVVVQQIHNTLATRHIRPRGPDSFELYWTYLGYEDDDEELTGHRLRQANLVGPSGYISMEDGEATACVQHGIRNAGDKTSIVEMGGRGDIEDCDFLVSEIPMRGFWKAYAGLMGHAVAATAGDARAPAA